jgi:sporulation protein YlmC with PRC-barrel domain
MLQLSSAFDKKNVMSLRTGTAVAQITQPIIDPNNLKIEGFYCQDVYSKDILILLYQDIRELLPQGFVIDDHDVLAQPEELVRLKDLLALDFQLPGMAVETQGKEKIGKVSDYATEIETMYIQKLYVARSMLKSLASGQLSVDRSQIVEITTRRVIIQDPLQGRPAAASAGIA